MPSIMSFAIPALFGLSGWVTGWIIHLGWSIVWGVVFAGIVSRLGWDNDLTQTTGAGLAYGVGLWVVNIVFIWPIWLQAVGFPKAPTVPNIAVMPLVGHVMFGVVAGVVYPFLAGRENLPP